MLSKIQTFKKWYTMVFVTLCTLICFVILGMNVIQVIMRYVIDKAFTYTEDITIMGMLYMMCLGISLGCINHEHLLINIIDGLLSEKQLKVLLFVEDIFIIFVGVIMAYLGNLSLQMNKGFVQSMIGFDEAQRYVPVVIGGILTSVAGIANVLEQIFVWKEEKTK